MADAVVKAKNPVPKGFQKKKPVEAPKVEVPEQLPPPPEFVVIDQPEQPVIEASTEVTTVVDTKVSTESYHEPPVTPEPKAEVDMKGLITDLMFNRFTYIMEKEAKPIAEKMVAEGPHTLHDVRWFLIRAEREQLASELSKKYGLN